LKSNESFLAVDNDNEVDNEEDIAMTGRWPCNHSFIGGLMLHSGGVGYFKKSYLDKTPWWPHGCSSECNCSKYVGDKVPLGVTKEDTLYKVARKNVVYMCENAANTCHPCVFSLCVHCKTKREQQELEQELDHGKRRVSAEDESRRVSKRPRKERAHEE
jgi:hypothetical protein